MDRFALTIYPYSLGRTLPSRSLLFLEEFGVKVLFDLPDLVEYSRFVGLLRGEERPINR